MEEELYKQNILEHYKHPHNKREIAGADMRGHGANSSCGDKIDFYIKLNGNKVADVSFLGEGCAISMAAVSMLTDSLKGKATDELKTISPGDIYNMLGVKISPGRINCALLGYEALSQALKTSNK